MRTEEEIRREAKSLLDDYNAIPTFKRVLPEWITTSTLILALKWVLEEVEKLPHTSRTP